MIEPAITLDVLPAAHGDCLLVQCPVEGRTWRMLVDTGPDDTYPALQKRLGNLPVGPNGQRTIDVFVVTHIDHDHIGGAALLLDDRSLNLSIGDVWFNAPTLRPSRGVEEGETLANILGARNAALPWNRAFGRRLAVTPADRGCVEIRGKFGEPRLTLLSPGQAQLDGLFAKWDKELAKLRSKAPEQPPSAQPVSRGFEALDIDALAARIGKPDRSLPNGSSIGLLIEHRGASLLLGADVYAGVLSSAVRALAEQRKTELPLQVDVFKVSHHGSRGNLNPELLRAVRATHYVFSTNNAIFNLPDDEAVSQVIVHGGPGQALWFNYATARNRRWERREFCDRYGYFTHYPQGSDEGLSIILPAKASTTPVNR